MMEDEPGRGKAKQTEERAEKEKERGKAAEINLSCEEKLTKK